MRHDAALRRTATSRSSSTRDGVLRCHHCGHAEPEPETCPVCRSTELARLGAGTQRLERELEAKLPELERDPARRRRGRAARRDGAARSDALRRRATASCSSARRWSRRATTSRASRWRRSSTRTPGSGMPDFRAEERTFQLLTQLAGRSGRDAPGRVLVQTFQPDSRAIELAARHDVAALPRRRARAAPRARLPAVPPPRAHRRLGAGAGRAAAGADRAQGRPAGDDLLGPAPLLRLRGKYRAQLVAKTDQPRRLAAQASRLLSAAAPAMRRAGLTARRRRRPAEPLTPALKTRSAARPVFGSDPRRRVLHWDSVSGSDPMCSAGTG